MLSIGARYNFSPLRIIAAPPVGISNICSFGLVQVIIFSTSAERNQPPVLPPKVGTVFVNLMSSVKLYKCLTFNI
jgi:hypothetical protein